MHLLFNETIEKKLRFLKRVLPLLVLFSTYGFSQNSKTQVKNEDYLVIDLSKSLPGNIVHDRIHYLKVHSHSIELPLDIKSFLDSIEDIPELHLKYSYARTTILQILYNPKISPDDKRFICYYYKDANDEMIGPITKLLKNYLKEEN